MNTILAVVTAQIFGRESIDKHGKQAIILVPVAGAIPNRNILSGTMAERNGFTPGKTYLVSCREVEPSKEYGRQFSWNKVVDISSPLEIIDSVTKLGVGSVFNCIVTEEVPEEVGAKKVELVA